MNFLRQLRNFISFILITFLTIVLLTFIVLKVKFEMREKVKVLDCVYSLYHDTDFIILEDRGHYWKVRYKNVPIVKNMPKELIYNYDGTYIKRCEK
jgi:hypothetical protein